MSKAKEVLEKLKQRRETAEAVRAYWAEMLPGVGNIPEPQLQGWMVRFDEDTIFAALEEIVIQCSKRDAKGEPMTADEAVSYASGVMQELRYRAMPEEERERIRAQKSAAGKKGMASRWHGVKESVIPCYDSADSVKGSLTAYAVAVAVGVAGSGSSASSGDREEKSKASVASLPPSTPSEEKSKATPKPKTKTIKTARGEKPKPDGFDNWTNVERTEWVACTLDCYESGWNFEHMRGCAACGQTQAKSAAAGESLIGRVEEL